MQSIIPFLLLIGFTIGLLAQITQDKTLTDCFKELNVTNASTIGDKLKPVLNCVMTKQGMIRNGVIVENITLTKLHDFNAQLNMAIARRVLNVCKNHTRANDTETAFKFLTCVRREYSNVFRMLNLDRMLRTPGMEQQSMPENLERQDSFEQQGDDMERQDDDMERQDDDMERQDDDLERQDDDMERQDDDMERQDDDMERQDDDMERQEDDMEKQDDGMERQDDDMERQDEDSERQDYL